MCDFALLPFVTLYTEGDKSVYRCSVRVIYASRGMETSMRDAISDKHVAYMNKKLGERTRLLPRV